MISEWQEYRGKRFFYCNYSNLNLEQLKTEMDAVDALIAQQPEASVLILTNVNGVTGSPQVVDLFKKSTVHTKKYIRRSVVIGIGLTGPKKTLFDLVMRFSGQNVVIMEDFDKARDWLVKEG
jgi:hypothetical protein